MKIKYKSGLLLVDIALTFNGVEKTIENMVLDTGVAKTLILRDAVDDIGVGVDSNDTIVTYYGIGGKEHVFRKRIDKVQMDEFAIENVENDFNDFGYKDINGIHSVQTLF